MLVSNQTFVNEHVITVCKNVLQDKQESDLHDKLGEHVRERRELYMPPQD